MEPGSDNTSRIQWLRKLKTAAYANITLWAISLIALVIILEKASSPKGLFVIISVGVVISIQIISLLKKDV